YYRLGDALLQAGKLADAEGAYQNSLTNVRKSTVRAGANFGLGEVYKKQGKSSLAMKHFTEAAKDRNWKQAAEHEIEILKNPEKYAY
ncbi:MAG: tetratricopeptide repeat protein, partial [Calditrichaeota bacterium]|nr:tetratricopeptide repeat protein [Calditrichota bacterium]